MKHSSADRSISAAIAALGTAALLCLPCPARLSAQQADTIGPTTAFSREIRFSASLRTAPGLEAASGFNLDLYLYGSDRLHDSRHRSLFGEEIVGPLTFLHGTVGYQPNRELAIADRGLLVLAEGIKTIGGPWGLGGAASYTRNELPDGEMVTDIEVGPQTAYWTSQRTYLLTRLAYRRSERERAGTVDDFLQIRNHIAYTPAEDWSFTYTQDFAVQIGLRDSPHTNTLRIDNNFIFSLSSRLSIGVKAGVDLSLFVPSQTSLITIPIGLRAELFPVASTVVTADVLYNLPTMIGQQTGGVAISGGVGFRF